MRERDKNWRRPSRQLRIGPVAQHAERLSVRFAGRLGRGGNPQHQIGARGLLQRIGRIAGVTGQSRHVQ
jgi:hypothetical protein